MKFYPFFFSLSISIALAGCGQMGPLYLPIEPVALPPAVEASPKPPETSKPVTTAPAATPPASNAKKPKEK